METAKSDPPHPDPDPDPNHEPSPTPTPNPNPNPNPNPAGDPIPDAVNSASTPEENTADTVNGSSPGKAQKSVRWSEKLVSESTYTPNVDPDTPIYSAGSSPYVSHSHSHPPSSLSSSASFKDKVGLVRNVLGKWGRNVKDAAKKAEDLAGNTWQHFIISS